MMVVGSDLNELFPAVNSFEHHDMLLSDLDDSGYDQYTNSLPASYSEIDIKSWIHECHALTGAPVIMSVLSIVIASLLQTAMKILSRNAVLFRCFFKYNFTEQQ